jgi:hypothetical protein
MTACPPLLPYAAILAMDGEALAALALTLFPLPSNIPEWAPHIQRSQARMLVLGLLPEMGFAVQVCVTPEGGLVAASLAVRQACPRTRVGWGRRLSGLPMASTEAEALLLCACLARTAQLRTKRG